MLLTMHSSFQLIRSLEELKRSSCQICSNTSQRNSRETRKPNYRPESSRRKKKIQTIVELKLKVWQVITTALTQLLTLKSSRILQVKLNTLFSLKLKMKQRPSWTNRRCLLKKLPRNQHMLRAAFTELPNITMVTPSKVPQLFATSNCLWTPRNSWWQTWLRKSWRKHWFMKWRTFPMQLSLRKKPRVRLLIKSKLKVWTSKLFGNSITSIPTQSTQMILQLSTNATVSKLQETLSSRKSSQCSAYTVSWLITVTCTWLLIT